MESTDKGGNSTADVDADRKNIISAELAGKDKKMIALFSGNRYNIKSII